MKSVAAFATLAAFVAQAVAQTALMINTPSSVVTCEPAQLSWTDDGSGPFFVTILPGNQPSASPLKQFPETSGTSLTWNVDIAAGTSITLALRDQTGQQVFSSAVTIQAGPSTSCVNSNVQESGASGSGAASATGSSSAASSGATSAAGSTAASGTTSASVAASSGFSSSVVGATSSASTVKSTSSASTSGSTSAPASSQSATSGAVHGTASVGALGLAGVMGVIVAALF